MNITKISITRPTIIVVIFTVLTLLGAFSYTKLNYELTPDISIPVVTVSVIYPGASPTEVENSVTKKVEDAVASLEKIDKLSSSSFEGVSLVKIEFNDDADINRSLESAQREVNRIVSDLPDDCKTPTLNKFDLSAVPIIKCGVTADIDDAEFYDIIKNRIQPAIARTNGVANVKIVGGSEREIKISIDADKLSEYNLSISDVRNIIRASNIDFPTGRIENTEMQSLIRLKGKLDNIDDIRELIIADYGENGNIKIKDVAEVHDNFKDVEIINRTNRKNSIGLEIQKQKDANAVELSASVMERVSAIEEEYADYNLKFDIAQDTSVFTLEAANAVMHDLLIAIILVTAVCLLFLHSLRNAFIVFVSIPTSIICVFIGMYLFDFTLNMMTLLGLSLVVGILVDDAIVVIENIHRHLEMKKSAVQAAYEGRMEIGFTAMSITLVDIVVFLPLSLVGGLVGDLFRQFGLVIVVSTLMSLFVSFTIVPLLASRFGKLEHFRKGSAMGRFIGWFEKIIDNVALVITDMLSWSFRHKRIVLAIAFVTFVLSFMLITKGFIGTAFMSAGDRGEFVLDMELPRESTIEQTNKSVLQVEKFLNNYEEIESVFANVGVKSGMSSSKSTPYGAQISIKLVSKDKRELSTDIFARKLKKDLDYNIVGVKFKTVSVGMMGNTTEAIKVRIKGDDKQSLKSFSDKAVEVIKSVEGTVEVSSSLEDGSPEIVVDIDREKMAKLGLNISDIGSVMQLSFSGNTDNKYRDGEYEYDINIILDKFNRRSIEDIKNISFRNRNNEIVKLKQIANFTEGISPAILERSDRMPSATISGQVIGRASGEVSSEIEEKLNELDKPQGIVIEMGGDAENQRESFMNLGIALLASIIFVYLIMVALYNSYVYPFVVLFSIPLSVIGALLALALAGEVLSIFSILGMIMLVGLVAKNAILVVDFTNQLKTVGMETKEALLKATRLRFRPILMTTLSMVIGLLPIALAGGAGAEWKNGLAWALIGGLSSSMILSLIVVPVVYVCFDIILAKLGMDKREQIVIEDS
jgi:hydrophobe/amphiphile efflux-1 (HAE1) family protein